MQLIISGIDELERLADKAERFSDDPLDGFDWQELAPVIAEHTEDVFSSEGYGVWPALSPNYAAWKEVNYPGLPILVLSGTYREAATTPGAAHNIIVTEDNYIFYGVEGLDYAFFHEVGAGNLPQRQVFGLLRQNPEFIRAVTETVGKYIFESFQGGTR